MATQGGIRFQTRVTGLGLGKELLGRLNNLGPGLRPLIDDIRQFTRQEFAGSFWYAPDGRKVPWKRTQPFGGRIGAGASLGPGRGRRKTLVDTGAYRNALTGGGAGSFAKVTNRSVIVGVSGSAFPHARFLRGGTGARIRTLPWVIRPKKRIRTKNGTDYAMRYKLGLEFGVWISKARLRRGLRLFPRPHMTRHPALVRRASQRVARYVATGRAA